MERLCRHHYEGDFANNLFDGMGKKTYADGRVKEGK